MFSFSGKPALDLRGFMICLHQMHDFMPHFGPNADGVRYLLDRMSEAKLNTLLFEYETYFPWSGDAARISCSNHFSEAEILSFSAYAKEKGIEIIPLVQVLGHVYHILIHPEFSACAEDPEIPQMLCPLSEQTRTLAKQLIDDTIRLHPGIRYIHLGGDECEQIGTCPKCREYADKHGKGRLFSEYMGFVTEYALSRGVTPILWHDVALRHPECLDDFDERVLFEFWNYGTASHGTPVIPFRQLLEHIAPSRIIGSPGARAESQHGALHHSPALIEANVTEINALMKEHHCLGSILTDWPDTGCSFLDSLYVMNFQGVSSWNGGEVPVSFRREYALRTFGTDLPELPASLDAIAGVTAFARGFGTRQTHPLNRYAREKYDYGKEVERIRRDYREADGEEELYRITARRYAALRFRELLLSQKERVTSHPEEYQWYLLLTDLTVLFLSADLGIRKECFTRKYFEEPSQEIIDRFQYQSYLREALESIPAVKSEYLALFRRYADAPAVERYLKELFSDSLEEGLRSAVQ